MPLLAMSTFADWIVTLPPWFVLDMVRQVVGIDVAEYNTETGFNDATTFLLFYVDALGTDEQVAFHAHAVLAFDGFKAGRVHWRLRYPDAPDAAADVMQTMVAKLRLCDVEYGIHYTVTAGGEPVVAAQLWLDPDDVQTALPAVVYTVVATGPPSHFCANQGCRLVNTDRIGDADLIAERL